MNEGGIEMLYPIVCFSHLRWNFVYQRPQHLMSRFARDGKVFFIEEPVFNKVWQGLQITQAIKGISVVVPHLYDDLPVHDNNRQIAVMLRDFFQANQMQDFIAWYYSPMAMNYSGPLHPMLTVYDCMDELSSFKDAPPELKRQESKLFDVADVVFTGGHTLFELKRKQHGNIYAFPSSIDKGHFATARQPLTDPEDQRGILHPRLGFYGVLDERFDIELVRELAKLRPEWSIVLLGPVVKIDPTTLPKSDNIHFLGAKGYSQLPAYLSGWDVAIMPFAINASTKYISPTKTPEYLAGGKPVVSTPISDVVNDYGKFGLVHIAKNAEEFVAHVESVLRMAKNDDWIAKVDRHLADNSWDKTWRQMSDIMTDTINNKTKQIKVS